MHLRRLAVFVSLLGAFAFARSGAFGGEDAKPDPEGFESGLARVQSYYEDGKGEKGLEALQELLAEHEGQGYARARRARLEDLAQRMAFQAFVDQPDPKELVSGKLSKWKPSSGELKIQYTPKTKGDLEKGRGAGFYWLPAEVMGPFVLVIEGDRYPDKTKDSPRIIFGGDTAKKTKEDMSWQVIFGTSPYTEGSNEVWMPATITRFDGDEKTRLEEKEITPAKSGKRFKLVLKVSRTWIHASVNSKSIGKAKKPKDVWGYVGFECKGWTDVTFSGKIEPSYIQSRIDKAVEMQRGEFERTYDRSKFLPAWLFEAVKTPAAEDATPADDLPEKLPQRYWKDLKYVYEALANEDYRAGLEAVRTMESNGAPAAACAFLAATLHWRADDSKAALAEACRCTKLAPGFLGAWLLQGKVLRQLGRAKEAADAFRGAIKCQPGRAEGYEVAALYMLYAGETAEARKFAEDAARKGIASEKLDLLNGALVKAVNGPTWSRVFEHKSRNYHVLSDIDEKTCKEASKILEEAYTAYRVNFGWVSRDKSKLFKVYLFAGRAGFSRYQADLTGIMGRSSERVAGLYSPLLKQLLIWNLPSREEMMNTIRHEGFHQYLDRLMPDPPTWFNEGLAVYHEHVERKNGSLVYGKMIPEYVELLKEERLVPLKEFLFQRHRQFYVNGHRSYAQAWAFVHMMRHGESEHRELLKRLVRDLQTDEAPADVLAREFADLHLMKLDKDLAAYVAAME